MEIPEELLDECITKLWEANLKVNKNADFYSEDPSFYSLQVKLEELKKKHNASLAQ